ncbi:hypothetical protein QBC35DRAFT_446326 [Podospora australis]|uniref:Allergen Asp f 4 n=1 Tax=Podospora australis TaxID=1536484 RepID=A0AAN6X8C3_9PEZI|nr:hypothetical protein QBC35DRAFT_446326 [Podospora australis]
MQLTHWLLLAGALGATAHPSGHAHLHRHARREGEVTFLKAVHNPAPPPEPTVQAQPEPEPKPSVAAAPEPKPTPSAAPAVKSEPEQDSDSGSGSDAYVPFCTESKNKVKRVTYEQIKYTGNLGTANGCPWNSNLMVVPNSVADKYKYIQKYKNVAKEPYQVVCGNKMGADGENTGSFKVAGQNQLVFTLQPGETKTVAADKNTQGICAWAANEVPTTSHGQFAGVWAEFDFENASNEGWSGADCSSLVAQAYKMDVPGCRMSHGGIDSTILPGGIGDNAYTIGMEALDGIGLNIAPGKVVIDVYVGFSG